MIFPAIIEKGHAAVDCVTHQPHGGGFILGVAQVMAAEAERRDLDIVAAETPGGDW
jgi:hypothetical protein